MWPINQFPSYIFIEPQRPTVITPVKKVDKVSYRLFNPSSLIGLIVDIYV